MKQKKPKYDMDDVIELVSVYNPELVIPVPMAEYFDQAVCTDMEGRDVCLVRIHDAHMHVDVSDHFISRKSVTCREHWDLRVDLMRTENGHRTYFTRGQFLDRELKVNHLLEPYKLRQCLWFYMKTSVGDCGAPVTAVDPSM